MKTINEYNSAILHLCEEFASKYFEGSDWHIIGNVNIWLWPLEVADCYFSIDEAVCALNNNIPREVLLKWYDSCLEDWKVNINLYNYFLLWK